MEAPFPPPLDAEKASPGQVVRNYRQPPGIGTTIDRSTLLVGSRGAGKTLYLRHQRHVFPGMAMYGDLFQVLAPVSDDLGVGGHTFEIATKLEPLVEAKTAGLLASWIAEKALDRGCDIAWDDLQDVLPPALRRARTGEDLTRQLELLYGDLFDAPIEEFLHRDALRALDRLVGNLQDQVGAPVLLLLDRAELVPAPCLRTIFHLLDQTVPYRTMVATRPGLLGHAFPAAHQRPIPGDHFALRHLGSEPYSQDWQEFVRSTLHAWMPRIADGLVPDHQAWLVTLSRDSLRLAIEITSQSGSGAGHPNLAAIQQHVHLVQQTLTQAAEAELGDVHPNLRDLLRRLRGKDAVERPTLLRITGGQQQTVFHRSDLDRLLDIGLRLGLFVTPHGRMWHPYRQPTEIEIPPIYLWHRSDPLWSITV